MHQTEKLPKQVGILSHTYILKLNKFNKFNILGESKTLVHVQISINLLFLHTNSSQEQGEHKPLYHVK